MPFFSLPTLIFIILVCVLQAGLASNPELNEQDYSCVKECPWLDMQGYSCSQALNIYNSNIASTCINYNNMIITGAKNEKKIVWTKINFRFPQKLNQKDFYSSLVQKNVFDCGNLKEFAIEKIYYNAKDQAIFYNKKHNFIFAQTPKNSINAAFSKLACNY